MTRRFAPPRRCAAGLVAAIVAVLGSTSAADAHRLKMFVTALDGEISGHAFFVGGGRPDGVDYVVRDATGVEVFRGTTDDRGTFRWRPAAAADYTVAIDVGDGHRVEATVAAERLAAAIATPPGEPPPATTAAASAAVPASGGSAAECPAPLDPAVVAKIVEAQVDRAVARQLRPLIEAYDQAEGRIRFNDIMGGVGTIVGLAGAGLWASSRRRRREGER